MARHLKAYRFVNTRYDRALDKLAFHFKMILVTVNAPLNWDIRTLKSVPQSQRQVARRVAAPTLEATVFPPIIGQCSFGGPPSGSPATILTMLEFALYHQIEPVAETFPMSKVNDALERLRSDQPGHRTVLVNEG